MWRQADLSALGSGWRIHVNVLSGAGGVSAMPVQQAWTFSMQT
jgi:hypothetical protein